MRLPIAPKLRFIEQSLGSPAGNLALDEALLNQVEEGDSGSLLRLWESDAPFVVLGVSQPVAEHVHYDNCLEDGVPVLRRCSAGGCVLQGPGCLNFALVLRYEANESLRTIRASYCEILTRLSEGLQRVRIPARHEGVSDLAIGGLKISGNSQKRRQRAFLHHGTLLYDFDIDSVSHYLREPRIRPDYRESRRHGEFLTNIPLARADLAAMILEAFGIDSAPGEITPDELDKCERLIREKYDRDSWNFRR